MKEAGPPPPALRLDPAATLRAERYIEALLRWGSKTNLVGPSVLANPWPEVVEALAAVRASPEPPRLLLDIGSGGGLPAIPLAIGWSCPLILLEPRQKRWAFLVRMLRELGIEGEALPLGWQEFAANPGTRRPDAVSCRALSGARSWMAALSPILAVPTRLFWFSGPHEEDAIEGFVHVGTEPLAEPGHLLRLFRRG